MILTVSTVLKVPFEKAPSPPPPLPFWRSGTPETNASTQISYPIITVIETNFSERSRSEGNAVVKMCCNGPERRFSKRFSAERRSAKIFEKHE